MWVCLSTAPLIKYRFTQEKLCHCRQNTTFTTVESISSFSIRNLWRILDEILRQEHLSPPELGRRKQKAPSTSPLLSTTEQHCFQQQEETCGREAITLSFAFSPGGATSQKRTSSQTRDSLAAPSPATQLVTAVPLSSFTPPAKINYLSIALAR